MKKEISEAFNYILLKSEYEPITNGFNYYLEKLNESLDNKNIHENLKTIKSICTSMTNLLEANNVLDENKKEQLKLDLLNNSSSDVGVHNRDIDNILVYIFLKTLMTIPTTTKAYKLHLIDNNGMLIRNPKTKEEIDSISNLDLLGFKLRKWLRPYLSKLSRYTWINNTSSQRYQNRFSGMANSIAKFYTIKRANDELLNLLAQN